MKEKALTSKSALSVQIKSWSTSLEFGVLPLVRNGARLTLQSNRCFTTGTCSSPFEVVHSAAFQKKAKKKKSQPWLLACLKVAWKLGLNFPNSAINRRVCRHSISTPDFFSPQFLNGPDCLGLCSSEQAERLEQFVTISSNLSAFWSNIQNAWLLLWSERLRNWFSHTLWV